MRGRSRRRRSFALGRRDQWRAFSETMAHDAAIFTRLRDDVAEGLLLANARQLL